MCESLCDVREAADELADEREWQADIEDELKEAEEDEKAEHAQRMETYKQELERWKKQRLNKVVKIRIP